MLLLYWYRLVLYMLTKTNNVNMDFRPNNHLKFSRLKLNQWK